MVQTGGLFWLHPVRADWRGGVLAQLVIIDKITPYNLWQELVEKQNMALGMVVAAMSLGISIIVAAAIHG